MTLEVVLLALASTIRPTSLAAIYALLSDGAPRRLMISYVAAGVAFTIVFGLFVVLALHGIGLDRGKDEAKGIAEIVGGLVLLTFAGYLLLGHRSNHRGGDAVRAPSRWQRSLERHRTIKTAALAGPLTHIPGIFYLVALSIISVHHLGAPTEIVETVLYNLIWFALPIVALALCIFRPYAAREAVAVINEWVRRHARGIVVWTSLGLGSALLVRGLLTV